METNNHKDHIKGEYFNPHCKKRSMNKKKAIKEIKKQRHDWFIEIKERKTLMKLSKEDLIELIDSLVCIMRLNTSMQNFHNSLYETEITSYCNRLEEKK